ncbi:RHS repeat-associated core domain-containing protein [Streptomyces sp. NPDC008317]|uniref:RHS repeat domain-containing protein n=1 Tax=Streptomyces sp. NPDC008317 TaxID=3364827 RepID=UPI0036ED2B30
MIGVAVALTVPLVSATSAQARGSQALGRPDVPKPQVSKVYVPGPGAKEARAGVAHQKAVNAAQAKRARAEQHTSWPTAASSSITLAPKAAAAAPGGLPVTLSAPGVHAASGSAKITVVSRAATKAAHVQGVLLSVTPQRGGSAKISVGYAKFASAYGGGWAGRLTLVRLPACALTTPEKAACRTQTPVVTSNEVSAQQLSATVDLAPAASGADSAEVTLLAATAGSGESASGQGTYKATELNSSATWAAGASSGSFTWSYPMAAPAPAAGTSPPLTLSYDSGSIDGQTANTNNQGSQVGEGFSLSAQSYVERRYDSCDDDGQDGKDDLCWKYDNASLVLNGSSTELVKDDTSGIWRLKDDDASKVERLNDTGLGNGDSTGEYWRITTGDGTQYYFGQNKLPGWSDHGADADDPVTNSVWTAPVFGDDAGEPGYSNGSTFADRSTVRAWRWNLDYVVDTHGNAMSYWYAKEANYYPKNGASTANAAYTRGGYLTKVLYGQRSDNLFATAPGKVAFTYKERCTAADCSSLTDSTAENWPDVPFDALCGSGQSTSDCHASGPSFFTRKRLTQIDTSVNPGTGDIPVDTWMLTQEYLDGGDIGDSSDQSLTLSSITRVGHTGASGGSGGDAPLDPVSFTYQWRANRVAGGTQPGGGNILPLTKPRISTVTSETGAITTVTLSPEDDCVRGTRMPAAEDNNTDSSVACYPVYWHINGAEDATLDWFHKYRVIAVTTADPAANNPIVEYAYDYSAPAWHHDDSPFTPTDERTWSQWRGYGTVTAYTGDTANPRSKTATRFMQGMNGDTKKDGTTRSVTTAGIDVTGLNVADTTDSDQYAGFTREQITYDGATPISVTVNDPWSKKTATQHKSYADVESHFVRTSKTATSTYLTVPKTWRTTATSTTYDSYGMPSQVDNAGDTAVSGDETCNRMWYARNDDLGINGLVSRARTVGQSCSVAEVSLSLPASSATAGDVLSDTATVYDNVTATAWTASQTPTKGEADWTGRASAYPATADSGGERAPSNWQKIASTTYDALGRPQTVTDVVGHVTRTDYTPTGNGPLTKTIVTNPKSQKSATFLDGVRGLPLRTYDVNSKKTELTYDGLGRTTGVWLPNRSKDAGLSANTTFAYHLKRGDAPYVATGSLRRDGGYNTTYTIYDALLRPLQTQSPTPIGGRILTDTRYDARGLAYETYGDIYDNLTAPNGTYARAEYGRAPSQHELTFDGAGRQATDTFMVFGVDKWTTTTSYTGDSTATTTPSGGSASRTITDALGRTVETRAYASTAPTDAAYGGQSPAPSYHTTKFTYTRDGKQATVTGPDSTIWSYVYDLFGRQISTTDPDKGTTTTAYTTLDQVDWTKDAGGAKLLYGYDELGRPTGLWQTDKTDPKKLAAWGFDTLAKGQLDYSTRYDGGVGGKAYTTKALAYDDLYHATTSELDLPATDPLVAAGAAQASYTFQSIYNIDGTLQSGYQPAAGGLPAEWVGYGYTPTGQVTTVSGASGYVLDTSYSPLGQPQQLTLGTSDTGVKKAFLTNNWEAGTGRLTRASVTDQTHAWMPQDLHYSYDNAGDVTTIDDPATMGGTGKADTQCYAYDGYQRMTEAWTPTNADCTTSQRTTTNLGGAAPYWSSYTYDPAGQRITETQHTTSGDTTTRSCYTNSAHPHALSATSTTATSCTGVPATYGYDADGNTTARPHNTASQTLTWNSEGKLASLTEGSKKATYLYDPDGNLLIRRAAGDGETVLYIGDTELHYQVTGATKKTWATRTYTSGTADVAIRTNESGTAKLSFLFGDAHGTSSLALDSSTQAITKRYSTPFGAPRGTAPTTWPDDKGFLGKTTDDSTGLTHVGAREYDPATGRFLSVDPLLDATDDQSLNGYTYADNNPASLSDPTGESLACGSGFEEACPHTPSQGRGDGADHTPVSPPKAPTVENEALQRVLNDIYTKPKAKSWVGDGKAATALRQELETGEMTKETWHVVDVADLLRRLQAILEDNRKGKINLGAAETRVALAEASDLWDGLNTVDKAGEVTKYLNEHAEAARTIRGAINRVANSPALESVTGSQFQERPYKPPLRTSGPRLRTAGMLSTLGGITDSLLIVDVVVQYLRGGISYCEISGGDCGPPPVA